MIMKDCAFYVFEHGKKSFAVLICLLFFKQTLTSNMAVAVILLRTFDRALFVKSLLFVTVLLILS